MSTSTLSDAGHKPAAIGHQNSAGHSLEVTLQRACAGDWAAWSELMSRFGRLLLHTARGIGLNDSDAADVAQLTWLRLWEHGHQIRDPECLPAWLTATARREGLRVALSGKRYVLCADPTAEHGEVTRLAVTDVYPIDGDYEPSLEQALTQLPAGYQRLIRLLMSDSCPSYTEVAKQLDLPIGSIGPMRMRALQMLRHATDFPKAGSHPTTAGRPPAPGRGTTPRLTLNLTCGTAT